MTRRAIIDGLPDTIRDELIEKALERNQTYQAIAQWLFQEHGITCSKSAIGRYCKSFSDKFSVLVNLGMPIKTIVENRLHIEARGVLLVSEELIDKLREKNSRRLFAYLDNMDDSQRKQLKASNYSNSHQKPSDTKKPV